MVPRETRNNAYIKNLEEEIKSIIVFLMLQQVAKIVETLHLLGALLISLLSLTLQPPSPLISVASETKKCWELKQSTLKGGEGRGSGKGLNSRYAEYWKLEKVFFN